MAYKRYDGFYGSALQKKIDTNLTPCPFCGENPHWLLEIETGFARNTVTCMCEKCGAKLNTESNGFDWNNNLRVVDLGSKNVNNLKLNATYHIRALNSLSSKTAKSDDYNSDISVTPIVNNSVSASSSPAMATVKNKWIWATVAFVAVFVIVLSITLGSRGCSSNINYLTYDNYMKIQTGMTYTEVVEILDGHQGQLDTESGYGGYTLKYYTWTNSSGTRCIVVGFENGRVCAKSQYGLT